MEEELGELRETVTQLKADNDRLRQEQSSAHQGPSGPQAMASGPPLSTPQSSNEGVAPPERGTTRSKVAKIKWQV